MSKCVARDDNVATWQPVVKALFLRWPVVSDEDLNDYVQNIKDNVINSQQQGSCGAQSNANINWFIVSFPVPLVIREVWVEWTHEPSIKENLGNSMKSGLDT